jgi:glycosyltransferase involved in cell wall biosynthesis
MAQITVIVPIYKVEKYIDRCVESILAQSYNDFDLVLVDDGSPDTCPQICDAYAEKDSRVAVIHKKNGGLSDARNAGIDWAMEHSDSRWLAFVDSDDYLHPDYLMTMLQAAQREDADLVICDFVRVDDDETVIEKKHTFFQLTTDDKRELFECMLKNWRVIPAWNKLYSKSIFDQLRFAFGKIHEDDFAIHHVLWNCHRAVILPDGLYYYRIRENSIMKTETPKSRLDGFEARVERYEFCLTHHVINGKSIQTDFLHGFTALKRSMNDGEKKRYNDLMKRFSAVFFSEPANRRPKRWLSFHFNGIYQKAGKLYHKLKAKNGNEG